MTAESLSLIMGLLFTMILEGVGALCWIQVARRRDSTAALTVTSPVTDPVTDPGAKLDATRSVSTVSATPQASSRGKKFDLDQSVSRAREAISANQIKPTVDGIMRFLSCGRDNASKVRNLIVGS